MRGRAPHGLWGSQPKNVPLTLRVSGERGAVTVLGAASPAREFLTALGLATQRPVLIGGSRASLPSAS